MENKHTIYLNMCHHYRKILNAKSCVDTSPPKVLQMKINNHWRYSRGTSSLQPKIVSSDMKKQFQQESVLKRSNNPVICQYYYQHHIKEMESPNLNKSFVVPKKPFSPTILKSNAQSKLRNLRVYHPPRKKRVILNVSETSQSSLVKRDDQEEDTLPNHIFNQSNVNNMKKQPSTTVDNNYSEESSEDSAYNEGECVLSSDSRGSTPQNSSFAPQLMKKRLIPSENIFGTSKLSVISKKNAVNDIMCIQFLKDITNDIIKKNIFTNKALRSTFEYHVKINKYNLNTEIMLKEISILQERLGVPKDEKFDNEDYGLGKDISEDEIENVNEIKNDEELSISFCNNTIKEVNNGNNETENEENTKNESEENYSDSFSDIDNSSISKSDQTKSDLSISETDQTKSGEHDENDTDNDEEVASVHIEEINEEEEEEGGSEKFSITEQNYNKTANSETDSDLEISEIC